MKFTILLALLTALNVSATLYSQDTKFNISLQDKTLREVIKTIESQSNFRFFFSDDYLDLNKKVTLYAQNKGINEILSDLLDQGRVTFKVMDNNVIVITPAREKQVNIVTGVTTDGGSGEPLIGVNVIVRGTTRGVVTDANGEFTIEANPGQTLVFSYVGYLSEEVAVGNQSSIKVSLVPDVKKLDEVVVVGYGTVKKTDLTGAVSSLGSKEVVAKGSLSALEAMQGQVAGVNISANSGIPGTNFKISIRGQNSLAQADALYVVDGIVTDNIDFLNPQDIQQIDILKDAASTAIYGSRGSNGVVIVTTKNAALNKNKGTTVTYDGYYGIREAARIPNFMNGREFWEFRQTNFLAGNMEAGNAYEVEIPGHPGEFAAVGDGLVTVGSGGNPNTLTSQLLYDRVHDGTSYYWPKYFLRTGEQQNHFLSISGQSKDLSYLLGVGYQTEKGNVAKEQMDKYNIKASIEDKLGEKWLAGANLNFALTQREIGSTTVLQQAFRMNPLMSPYSLAGEDVNYPTDGMLISQPGKYAGINFTSTINPLLDLDQNDDNTKRFQGLGNVYLQFAPTSWISIRTTYSPSLYNERHGRYQGPNSSTNFGGLASADLSKNEFFSSTWDNQINVNKKIKDHSFNFMGLASTYGTILENDSTAVYNMPYKSEWDNLGSAGNVKNVYSNYVKTTMVSFVVRLNYAYKDKYLLTLSNRWDGSSRLAKGHKWQSFPSAAISWRVSEENFMKSLVLISNFKLRASYGTSGNNNVKPYQTQVYANAKYYYDFYGTAANGFSTSGLSNSTLTWEKTHEINVGLDYGFFTNRISGAIDVYNKLSENLLMNQNLPYENGFNSVVANVGSVRNKGIELSLRTVNVKTKDFVWETSFNFAKNKNEIVELFGAKNDYIANSWFIGQPINVNYTYVADGVWQEADRALAKQYGQSPGQTKVVDFTPDIVDSKNNPYIDLSDKRIIGSPDPKWTGGASTRITFKGFDLSASLITKQGMQVFSYFHQEFTNFSDRGRAKLDVDYYRRTNDLLPTNYTNKYPEPGNTGVYYNQVAFYKDASFVKVKNINLGFTLPANIVNKLKIKGIRIYVNVLNPFVWTKYQGFDPEWANAPFGQDGISFITYQFGTNFQF
jgi:TonB-linked SusC/RagA family outer membrane protein